MRAQCGTRDVPSVLRDGRAEARGRLFGEGGHEAIDLYYGISGGAILTGMLANGHTIDGCMAAFVVHEGGRVPPLNLTPASEPAARIDVHQRVGTPPVRGVVARRLPVHPAEDSGVAAPDVRGRGVAWKRAGHAEGGAGGREASGDGAAVVRGLLSGREGWRCVFRAEVERGKGSDAARIAGELRRAIRRGTARRCTGGWWSRGVRGRSRSWCGYRPRGDRGSGCG